MANFSASYPPLLTSGGGSGVTSLNSLTGALTLAAGTNITITPSGGDTLTIASTGGSASWGSITGASAQVPPSGGFSGTILAIDGATDPMLLLKSGVFSGVQLAQDSATAHATLSVLDATKDLLLLPGSTSGHVYVGFPSSAGGLLGYTNIPYTILGGFVGAVGDNTHSLGTDETGALVNGNRWKDGLFGTSLRAPLFSNRDETSAGVASTVTVSGVHNAGAGAGGILLVAGGTGGADGKVQIGRDSTAAEHILNVASDPGNAGVLTLTNGPSGVAGNPSGYVLMTINGQSAYMPFWNA